MTRQQLNKGEIPMANFLKIAPLSKEDVGRIRELEEAIGKHIMAFVPGLDVADLSREQVAQVQALEAELGVTLLVYEAAA
jgi:hypothetical protein